jgi:hypothetical protein
MHSSSQNTAIPPEIWDYIFAFVPHRSLPHILSTCKAFYEIGIGHLVDLPDDYYHDLHCDYEHIVLYLKFLLADPDKRIPFLTRLRYKYNPWDTWQENLTEDKVSEFGSLLYRVLCQVKSLRSVALHAYIICVEPRIAQALLHITTLRELSLKAETDEEALITADIFQCGQWPLHDIEISDDVTDPYPLALRLGNFVDSLVHLTLEDCFIGNITPGISWPRVHTLSLIDLDTYHKDTLIKAFPNVVSLRVIDNWGLINNDWDEEILETGRAENLDSSNSWALLRHIKGDANILFSLKLRAETVTHLEVDIRLLRVEDASCVASVVSAMQPIILSMSIYMADNLDIHNVILSGGWVDMLRSQSRLRYLAIDLTKDTYSWVSKANAITVSFGTSCWRFHLLIYI